MQFNRGEEDNQSLTKRLIPGMISFVCASVLALILLAVLPVRGVQSDAVIILPPTISEDVFVQTNPYDIVVRDYLRAQRVSGEKSFNHRVKPVRHGEIFLLTTYGRRSIDINTAAQENRIVLSGIFEELGRYYDRKIFSDQFVGMTMQSIGSVYTVTRTPLIIAIAAMSGLLGGVLYAFLRYSILGAKGKKARTIRKNTLPGIDDLHESMDDAAVIAEKEVRLDQNVISDVADDYMQSTLSLSEDSGEKKQEKKLPPFARLLQKQGASEKAGLQYGSTERHAENILAETHKGWTHDHWEEMQEIDNETQDVPVPNMQTQLPTLEENDEESVSPATQKESQEKVVEEGDNPRVSQLLSGLSKSAQKNTSTLPKNPIQKAVVAKAAPGNLPVVDPEILSAFAVSEEVESEVQSKILQKAQDVPQKTQTSEDGKIDFDSQVSQTLIESVENTQDQEIVSSVRDITETVAEPTPEELKERLNKLLRGDL